MLTDAGYYNYVSSFHRYVFVMIMRQINQAIFKAALVIRIANHKSS